MQGVLENGEEIAVKKLNRKLSLDAVQFKNELVNLMNVQHQNTVQLIGYCYETRDQVEERAVCFEYLPRGSLDKYLSGMIVFMYTL